MSDETPSKPHYKELPKLVLTRIQAADFLKAGLIKEGDYVLYETLMINSSSSGNVCDAPDGADNAGSGDTTS